MRTKIQAFCILCQKLTSSTTNCSMLSAPMLFTFLKNWSSQWRKKINKERKIIILTVTNVKFNTNDKTEKCVRKVKKLGFYIVERKQESNSKNANDKVTGKIHKKINKELAEDLLEKSIGTNSIDGVFDFLESLPNLIQEDFDELIEEDSVKKRFIWALTRIFAPLLNAKVNSADKIKRILKIAVETMLKIWQEQN